MKKVFFALILSFFAVANAEADEKNLSFYRQECLSFISRPKVEVYGSYGKLRYNYEKDSAYLTQEQAKKVKEYSLGEGFETKVLGLTKMRDSVDFKAEFSQLALSQGYYCLYPEHIQIMIDYYLPTIYIAKELEKGTCLYDITLRHERTHAQIYIEALDYFLPRLKKYADALFDNVGIKIVAKGESVDEAMKDLSAAYHDAVQKKINGWYQSVEKEQFKMDTPEQYMLESRICQDMDAQEDGEF